jgi:hypothetical protein
LQVSGFAGKTGRTSLTEARESALVALPLVENLTVRRTAADIDLGVNG